MSKIMWILGILLAAAGVALGIKSIMSPGQMDILGLKADSAAVLLVGGIMSLGLGSVIDGLKNIGRAEITTQKSVIKTVGEDLPETVIETPTRIPGFGRKGPEYASMSTSAEAALPASKPAISSAPPNSVADTIAALDQAKMDIKNALGGVEAMTSPVEELQPLHVGSVDVAQLGPQAEPVGTEAELYVLEEKIIRGRPSRILSDDTVEAETDEGWMRFENLEHLNEYLDSLGEDQA